MLQRPIIESTGLALYWRVLQEIWRVALVTGTGKWDTLAEVYFYVQSLVCDWRFSGSGLVCLPTWRPRLVWQNRQNRYHQTVLSTLWLD